MLRNLATIIVRISLCSILLSGSFAFAQQFEGAYYSGKGDTEYLELLDIARRMFAPDPELQNAAMLYTPRWNGFVEGPTWGAWWVQNSYGPTYCALPFYQEPYITFLQNAQDLWFDQMGDGKSEIVQHRKNGNDRHFLPPDGALCDCAAPGYFMPKQGDGKVEIHDWGMEFTAAGLLLQTELLLISRDPNAIDHYLPMLERCAEFIESRRDPKMNLYWAGPAANLLAPSYAGYKKPDGTYDKAYLTGLSITTIAALDRLIELEKLAGHNDKADLYKERRDATREGLKHVTTDEGYFIKSLDPDGVKHGVYGAEKYGYFEASPNHDAIAFRVADEQQAKKIYRKIAALPGLRPHDFIIANYPGLDDMYEEPEGNWLWSFGTWVNGGHWSTCEARMVMAYYRLGQYEDARRSMLQLMKFARQFRMDNPLVEFGNKVYQPKEPINLCYDSFGPPAALIRGLFEYIYSAQNLILIPHIPPGITAMDQKFPIRFGKKKIHISTTGNGRITSVLVNGKEWTDFNRDMIRLPYETTPDSAQIQIGLGGAELQASKVTQSKDIPMPQIQAEELKDVADYGKKAQELIKSLQKENLNDSYVAAHARLIIDALAAAQKRFTLLSEKKLELLPEESQKAADRSYIDTITRLYEGFDETLKKYAEDSSPQKQRIAEIWKDIQA